MILRSSTCTAIAVTTAFTLLLQLLCIRPSHALLVVPDVRNELDLDELPVFRHLSTDQRPLRSSEDALKIQQGTSYDAVAVDEEAGDESKKKTKKRVPVVLGVMSK